MALRRCKSDGDRGGEFRGRTGGGTESGGNRGRTGQCGSSSLYLSCPPFSPHLCDAGEGTEGDNAGRWWTAMRARAALSLRKGGAGQHTPLVVRTIVGQGEFGGGASARGDFLSQPEEGRKNRGRGARGKDMPEVLLAPPQAATAGGGRGGRGQRGEGAEGGGGRGGRGQRGEGAGGGRGGRGQEGGGGRGPRGVRCNTCNHPLTTCLSPPPREGAPPLS